MPSKKLLEEKQAKVEALSKKLLDAQSFVLADFRGLTVDQDTALRKAMREAGIEYKVIKNSIISFAIKDTKLNALDKYLSGPTAIAIGSKDPIVASKLLAKYAKDFDKLEIKGGAVEGKVIDVDGVKDLASTPSKEELIARMLGSLQGPLYGLAAAIDALAEKQSA